jgi:cytochrome c oxidase assembly protein subunit 15
LMSDGQLMHESVILEKNSWLLRLTEGKSGVQFVHRTIAYVVVGLILFLYYKSKSYATTRVQKKGLNVLVIIVFLQFALGVFTLLCGVPMWLGLTHQIVAFLLLATMTFTLHRLSK